MPRVSPPPSRRDHPCKRCNGVMVDADVRKVYCDDCVVIVKRERNRDWMRRAYKESKGWGSQSSR
jgi:hypothetical protein